MWRFCVGGVICLLTFYTSMIYQSTSLLLICVMELSFLLSAFFILQYQLCHVRVRIRLPIVLLEKQVSARVCMEIENASIGKLGTCRCRVECKNTWGACTDTAWLTAFEVEKGKSRFDYTLCLSEEGNYQIRLKRLRIYDWTGFLYLEKTLDSQENAVILPDIREVAVSVSEAVLRFEGEIEACDMQQSDARNEGVYDLREFSAGDRLQSIHWKMSAKMNEWMVCKRPLQRGCPVVVLAHNAPFAWVSAISFSLMDKGCFHYLCWHSQKDEDLLRVSVTDEESYYCGIVSYMTDQTGTDKKKCRKKRKKDKNPWKDLSLKEWYLEKYAGELYMHLLEMDDGGQLRLNDETIAHHAFEEIELIL